MKKAIARLILLAIVWLCIWSESDRRWWLSRFKLGGF